MDVKTLKVVLVSVCVAMLFASVAWAGGDKPAETPASAPAADAKPAETPAPGAEGAEKPDAKPEAAEEGVAAKVAEEPDKELDEKAEEEEEKESFLDVLRKGGYTMIPIGLASLIALASILNSFFSLRRSRVLPEDFVGEVRKRIDANDAKAAMQLCRQRPSPIANILGAGLRKHGKPTAEIEKSIEDAGSREINSMRQSIRVLSAVGVVTPLLGLFGTVLGIYTSFGAVAKEAGVRPEVLAVGINEALITTISGLMVAIPSYAFYFFFRSRVDTLVYEIEELSIDVVEHMSGDQG